MRYLFRRNPELAEKCEVLLRMNPGQGEGTELISMHFNVHELF